ncbi:restriction endonuclease [Clostridium acidisoli]|nr:restriction endonuclease [Clostridium acidisoli]
MASNINYEYLFMGIFIVGLLNIIYIYYDTKKTRIKVNRNIIIDKKVNLTLDDIKKMNGREFEIWCAKLLTQLGYKVKITQQTNDEGKDLIVDKSIYVECKCWDEDGKNIGREILQKLIGAMVADGGKINKGICVTTSGFNKNAIEYKDKINKNTNIELKLYDLYDIECILKDLEESKTDMSNNKNKLVV